MRNLRIETVGWATLLVCFLTAPAARASESFEGVRIWQESIVIPTYEIGPPDSNPIFYSNESYQGAQKRVYPYPLQDLLLHTRKDRTYIALNLENEYIRLTVLPELGGRIFAATDKTNNYDFFYRQHVIKPALIGMLGAWISGGVEWCCFHHHRNTTFMPVDYTLAHNPDGSKTIWIGETERRHRMKWLIGLTLQPGRSYIQATVKFFNRTPQPHSILYWANAAVHVNDNYQIIFPPSVQIATYHSKIDFTHWPVSQGRYRGIDYKGVDISWWKNSQQSNSFFAWDLQEDFMGGYDHGRQAGVVHVANHHLVCGAKLWEWGTGPYGRLWDSILTDTDGPYAELMVGAWSDNQPDYSWIKPYEVKVITQYWYPVRQIGPFKNANLNGAANVELKPDGQVLVGFHTTARHRNARATLKAGNTLLLDERTNIGPDAPFCRKLPVPAGTRPTDLRAALLASDGTELIAYQPVERTPVRELPQPARTPAPPREIATVEQLYLTGLRVEQIHNPRVDPLPYYHEALKRDPGDSRCNTALGIHFNKRGDYRLAEQHLRRAIERITAEYTRPANAEAYYQLGIALRAQGRQEQACDSFYRAAWDYACHSAAYCQLAELSCQAARYAQALEQIEQAISTNSRNTKAQGIRAMILRKLGRPAEAAQEAGRVLAYDPLDFLAANELYLAQSAMGDEKSASATLAELSRNMRGEVQSYLELAADYLNCGQWDEAIQVLQRPIETRIPFAQTYPLVHYYLGYLTARKGNRAGAQEHYARAANMPADYCFPFRLETLDVLTAAIEANPSDARAHYYLGNLLLELQPDRAVACWEKARELDDQFAPVHRNLGWAYYRVRNNLTAAIQAYEKAIACNRQDPRLFLELDSVYETANVAPEKRLAVLEHNHQVVCRRQDSFLREIALLVLAGRYEQAIAYLSSNHFHAREGAEGIHDVFVDAHLLEGLAQLKQGKASDALGHFQKASEYPENLSVGRPALDRRAPQIAWCAGMACQHLGDADRAAAHYRQAAELPIPADWPDARYYQALCLRKLRHNDRAERIFDELVRSGQQLLERGESADFFAKFGEEQARRDRTAAAHFSIGLGLLGKGRTDEAILQFEQAVRLNAGHLWARYQLSAAR